MPDDPVVQLIHAEPLGDGRERIVAILEGGDIVVAARKIGEERAQAEISFNPGEASRLARLALGGNSTTLTMPGLSRILCASVIALSMAAAELGAPEASEK